MEHTWQLQAAKARLSQLVRAAQTAGPQTITLHGRAAAVLMAYPDFERLSSKKRSLAGMLRSSPLAGMHLPEPTSHPRTRPRARR